ncbi:thioredoxin family protein [Niastella populi]|nr:thioredoxin family protein [Niastella populi]
MNFRLLILILLTPAFSFAQFLSPDAPLQQAYIKATQQDRLIFLMIESEECQQCNDVADKAFQNDSLKNYVAANFVALRISPFHSDLNLLRDKYNYQGGNSVLFLDKWGTLVYRMNMSTTEYSKYLLQCRIALTKKAEADQLRSLEQDALTGKIETDRLYQLMQKRRTLSLPIDALLDQYVKQLPADSLNSITTIKRIAKMSPVLQSKADSAMRGNEQLFHQAWNSFYKGEQLAINREIIFKSRQAAVEEKSLSKAVEAAKFARLSHTDKDAGENAYNYSMMEFHRHIKDTAAFLKAAVVYYDRFLKKYSADSIKKLDSLRMAALARRKFNPPAQDTVGRPANFTRTTSTIRYRSQASHYSQLLNNGARSVYLMTNNPVYLKKALQWSVYANRFFETPYVLDTWARLVFKVDKNVDWAIQLEEKAIAILKNQGYSAAKHEEVVSKMKKNEIIR